MGKEDTRKEFEGICPDCGCDEFDVNLAASQDGITVYTCENPDCGLSFRTQTVEYFTDRGLWTK